MRRQPIEYFLIAEAIVAALDEGATQRDVAEHLGVSQTSVSKYARWYLEQSGETRWWSYTNRSCQSQLREPASG